MGKTVQGVAETTVEGENGSEPCVTLLFTDGTRHGFVLPGDGWDGYGSGEASPPARPRGGRHEQA